MLTTGSMVFTVRVRTANHRHPRRTVDPHTPSTAPLPRRAFLAVLGGATAVGLSGCGISGLGAPTVITWHPSPDVLLPFLASTITLADRYDAAIAAAPGMAGQLTPLLAAHRQHIAALRRELGLAETNATPAPTAGGTPMPTDRAGILATLRTAEQRGQAEATTFCLAAPSYRAALLGSIAACRATHVAVLG